MNPTHSDAERVWQRVLAPNSGEQQTLQTLIGQLELDLRYLKQQVRDPLLIKEYTQQLSSLRGIAQLTGTAVPRGSGKEHSLTRCFDNALARLGAYQLRSSDPVYGPVFRELARQTEHHCFCITQLLGSQKESPNF